MEYAQYKEAVTLYMRGSDAWVHGHKNPVKGYERVRWKTPDPNLAGSSNIRQR